jgi:protein-histidine pros-kinase
MTTCVADYPVTLADGSRRWLRLVGQPRRDEAGNTVWDCVTMDVSRRKAAEEALRQSEGRLQAILDTAQDAFVSTDEYGRILAWNARAEAMFGWTAKEAIGRTLAETIIPERLRLSHIQDFARWRALGDSRRVGRRLEQPACRRDGTEFPIEISASSLRSGDGLTFNAFIADISERAEAQRRLNEARVMAEHASRSKSDFLAAMSHELRTPLTSILGFSEVLQSRGASMAASKIVDYAAHIQRAGAHLLNLINDVLDLSKAEAGRIELRPDVVAVPGVIEQAVAMIRERAHDLGVQLSVMPAPGDLPAVWADERQLLQVVINLLSNAVKFTPAGGSVVVSMAGNAEGMVELRVADTGIGIEPGEITRALAVFGQIDSSIARKHTGTGLGLPLARKIVELHGGSLEIQSAIGVGTTVTVCLPAVVTANRFASVA